MSGACPSDGGGRETTVLFRSVEGDSWKASFCRKVHEGSYFQKLMTG